MSGYLKIKKINDNAKIPTRAYKSDAGMDVYSPEDVIIYSGRDAKIGLGWKCEFPDGWVLLVFNKSGRAVKDKLDKGAETIDSGYRGEVHVHLFNHGKYPVHIKKGEKIAQIILMPCWTGIPEEVTELNENTERKDGGFGSTGLQTS